MVEQKHKTFIVDCHECRAKVAAIESGRAETGGVEEDLGEPYGERVLVGKCPVCKSLLVGQAIQVGFENINSAEDRWTDVVRVFPDPPRGFSSSRIPNAVTLSLLDADRALQASANIAACVMFGRALEAVCRDALKEANEDEGEVVDRASAKPKKRLLLGEGIKQLLARKIIDDRLYQWGLELKEFRNLAAHPDDSPIAREDAEDLQSFVHAIVEYVYDLADRYAEFQSRAAKRKKGGRR
ncbi:MAG: DUF4145 domain-containing protein [Planctomycetes bacterium]|nr:DUF4145 domain-containing protein [Planctomycetota bacterium]